MPGNWWLGAGLGAGLGLAYSASSYVLTRLAAGLPSQSFMLLFFGGMVVRMTVALALVALALALVPMRHDVFIGSFLVIFIAGLIAEVMLVHRSGGLGPRSS